MTIFGSGIWLPSWISEYILPSAWASEQFWPLPASITELWSSVLATCMECAHGQSHPQLWAICSKRRYCRLYHCPGVLCVCGWWTRAANVCWRVSLSHPPPPPASFLPHGCDDSWGTYIIVSCNALTFHAWWSPWWEKSCTGLLRSWFANICTLSKEHMSTNCFSELAFHFAVRATKPWL